MVYKLGLDVSTIDPREMSDFRHQFGDSVSHVSGMYLRHWGYVGDVFMGCTVYNQKLWYRKTSPKMITQSLRI